MDKYYAFPFDVSTHHQTWATWKDGFTGEQLDAIVKLGDSLIASPASIGTSDGGQAVDPSIRRSQVAWIDPTPDTEWLFLNLAKITRDLNKKDFGFALTGLLSLQYTVYSANDGEGGYYDWHIDRMGVGAGYNAPRKLSMSLQLSDMQDYEGGELWIDGLSRGIAPKDRGMIAAFPSTTKHRVTPVTAGIRKSLVAWVLGPDFR